MYEFSFHWLDVFSDSSLSGNACVVLESTEAMSAASMQRLAAEFNVGETCFLRAATSSSANASARIFTPVEERPYAGVPVLSMAHIVAKLTGKASAEPTEIILEIPAGQVTTWVRRLSPTQSEASLISFPPIFDPPISDRSLSAAIAETLGLERNRAQQLFAGPAQVVSTGTRQLLVMLREIDLVRAVRVDAGSFFELRKALDFASLRVFCASGCTAEGDCFGRHFYASTSGVAEDAFTGSSAGSMAAYLWHHKLVDKTALIAEQGHDLGRPGKAVLEWVGSRHAIEGVRITGVVNQLVAGTLSY